MRDRCVFTVFIPSFNRATLLKRAIESVGNQTVRNFELLIVDDGSTDNTKDIVEMYQTKFDFPVHYHFQKNQGKHVAHNSALKLARGSFIVILDSDDMLVPNALERLEFHWKQIPEKIRDQFAGIEGHCAYSNGEIVGTRFPSDILDSNFLETRRKLHIGGDKKNSIRTDVLREFPFPVFEGEKFIRESIVWDRIARKYSFRYVNEVIQIIEYQDTGLSSNLFNLRVNNPKGFRLCFKEEVNLNRKFLSFTELYKSYVKYVRYSFHCGIGLNQQHREIESKILWLISIPVGTIDWYRDKFKIKKRVKNA
jgi:glycosyltransferase involved in cell wall biosynthesis